ncbi:hypothetical protein ACH4OW_01735 [Streptomyces sp. NPDC017056]|uniref:hypothetical protein n=1 Tax=Streptomyces sp. NPDC017056 TaxID=3364973 RepID=UPI0037B4052F
MGISNENTAAHHLHTLLKSVRDSGEQTLRGAWCKVLDADMDSSEFARRHSEVVMLLQMTIRQLNSLPERSRLRCERYVADWWTVVVQPIHNWGDHTRTPQSLFPQDKLDHLESAADLISGNLIGSGAAPRSADLDEMAMRCNEWIDLLTAMSDAEIDGPVRDALISQVRHLLWLIENATMFGGARVAEEASTVIGSLTQASATLANVQPNHASRWKKMLLGLIAACVVFNQAAPVLQGSITAGEELVKEITAVANDFGSDE